MKFAKNMLKNILCDDSGFFWDYIGQVEPYSRYTRRLKRDLMDSLVGVKLPSEYKNEIKDFWRENFNLKINTYGYKYFYAFQNSQNINYIPEDIFFKYIIGRLNRFNVAKAYADKNVYNKLFPNVQTPKTVIRNINGRFFDDGYNLMSRKEAVEIISDAISEDKLIVKPSVGGGGKNITLIDTEELHLANSALKQKVINIIDNYGKDYIIQHYFHQNKILSKIYPHSLNTMRIVTFETGVEIKILARVLKMGNNNHFLDKVHLGGLSCGIDEQGYLNAHAFGKDAREPLYFHPQTGIQFEGIRIPNFGGIQELVKNLHQQISHNFRFVSWDVSLDIDNNPVLIESNIRHQGIMIPQINCGPIFGENTFNILREVFELTT